MDYNTVIIGSGVAGMTAAIYLARANVSVCILEKEVPGGQITKTSDIDNYPGFISIDGPELAINIHNQVKASGVDYKFTEGLEIVVEENRKIVKTKEGEITCQNIIIATGRSPRKLGIPNEDRLSGRGISWCAICDGAFYKDKDVAVIGGGRAALEESLYLSKICSNITLIHRNDTFKADDSLVDTVKATPNITILANKNTKEFIEEDGKLAGIKVIGENREEEIIPVVGCFEYIGQVPNTEYFKNLDILDNNGYIEVNENLETKVKNIYAVGDCIKKELYQIITACSEGAQASSRIIKSN